MKPFNWQEELDRDGHRLVFSGQTFAMHCHHYNINLQKMLEEALGETGVALLYDAAEKASFHNFEYLFARYDQIKTLKSKLEMVAIMYQNCGLGILHFRQIGPDGGILSSPASHHVTGWLAKHGRRETAGCHFSRGWIGGVMSALFGKPTGYYDVRESSCKMKRDRECVFEIGVR